MKRRTENDLSRKDFLGTTGVAAAGIGAAAAGMGGVAHAIGGDEPWENVVYPTGSSAQDLTNVQNAVSQGGRVLLMSTDENGNPQQFNFDFGTVYITVDVEIHGETDNQGNPLTKIGGMTSQGPVFGGVQSFTAHWPEGTGPGNPPAEPGPKIVIKGIHFSFGVFEAIKIRYCSGAVISGNKIDSMIPLYLPDILPPGVPNPYPFDYVLRGIDFGDTDFMPGPISGDIEVSDNVIDLANISGVPNTEVMGQGVFILGTMGAKIRIRGNAITNVPRNAIECLDNYRGDDGSIVVGDNSIVTPTEGLAWPSPSTPNGLVVGWFYNLAGGSDPTTNPDALIANNTVEINGETSGGIVFFNMDNGIAKSNHVISNGSSASGIVLRGAYNYVGQNKIVGTGNAAIYLMGEVSDNNVLVGNNVSGFSEAWADVVLDTDADNNVLAGGSGTLYDGGTGNIIKGSYTNVTTGSKATTPGGIGPMVSEETGEWGCF